MKRMIGLLLWLTLLLGGCASLDRVLVEPAAATQSGASSQEPATPASTEPVSNVSPASTEPTSNVWAPPTLTGPVRTSQTAASTAAGFVLPETSTTRAHATAEASTILPWWKPPAPTAPTTTSTSTKPTTTSTKPTTTTTKPTTKATTTSTKPTTKATTTTTKPTTKTTTASSPSSGEIRGAWVAYYEIAQSAGGVSKSAFIKKADALFKKMADYGINTVFLHVRPFSDAIYPSKLAPWSDILTGTQGGNPGYDPLQIFCDLAAQYRLALHAWINPFRISRNDDLTKLAASNPALAHIEANDGWVRKTGGQYYWNPAMPETHALIYAAVKELLGKYSLAGLHIDDYFYPTTAASFDAAQYKAYQTAGGKLALGDWRREMVSLFVQGLYRTAKQAAPGAVVSISPAGNLKTVRTEMFADVPRWMAEPGYADWMIPQVYFGFENAACPFAKTASDWAALPRHSGLRLLFGLAAYKCGQTDAYAGAGKEEWKTNSDILARQLKKIRTLNGYSGFSLFSYEFIGKTLSGIALQERENFQKMLTATH